MIAHVYNYDPTLAPEGKTVVSVLLETRYDAYWTNLRDQDPQAYEVEKAKLAQDVIERLERRFGNIWDRVEVIVRNGESYGEINWFDMFYQFARGEGALDGTPRLLSSSIRGTIGDDGSRRLSSVEVEDGA